MSDTPRTDAACGKGNWSHCVDDDFARSLERELNSAQSRISDLQARVDSLEKAGDSIILEGIGCGCGGDNGLCNRCKHLLELWENA